jgi:type III restriction enzyme
MQLKEYQDRVINEVRRYLDAVLRERQAGNIRHASMDAWQQLRLGAYYEQTNGLGEDYPNFTIKAPTGAGKTVLATQILGVIYQTILQGRNGAGLVLWVVPSSQIYRDTLRRLSDRNDWYRIMLEHAVSRRIEVWEKTDIARLTPVKLRDNLNILIVQLASTNRETQEQLKFFRDSGGNIVQHFPPEDDPDAHRKLKEDFPNLDMIEDNVERGRHLVATSVGNLVRLCRPAVILDEGHKATSRLARETVAGFNAAVLVELTATPKESRSNGFRHIPNILCRVSGTELLREEMIKLPLNIATSQQRSWESTLTMARDKRITLARAADDLAAQSPDARRIRPIVLVQVERTGTDQRGQRINGRVAVHADDVKEYLMQRLDIPETAIAIKTSARDELNVEGVDLDDPECPIEWIITKQALQEGWDCPFAYILVALNNTESGQAMTQLVGRILRQPYQEKTGIQALDESYVYCLHKRASTIAQEVKSALEDEGYEGDSLGLVVDSSGESPQTTARQTRIQEHYSRMYRQFDGKIYLPHFCVKSGDKYEPLDYFEHLLSQVDADTFAYGEISGEKWHLANAMAEARDRYYRWTLGQTELERQYETDVDQWEDDSRVLNWLVASLPFDYLSFKKLRRIVRRIYDRLRTEELPRMVEGHLALIKTVLRDKIARFVQEQVDKHTEIAFRHLFDEGRVVFYLECAECRFQIPDTVTINSTRRLVHHDGEQVQRSLFDYVEDETHNEYERAVALALDRDENVLWWYRNLIGDDQFAIQGYRKNRIRPDFVVKDKANQKPCHRVIVVESKGKHLESNPDTDYKRHVAQVFEKVGHEVTWQQLGEDFKDHIFRFQILDEAQPHGADWKDALTELLQASD